MDALIQIGFFLILLMLGYVFGRRSEAKHYKSIKIRENNNKHIIVTTERLPEAEFLNHNFDLVNGNVVISVDYFKVVAAGLRKIIGGRVRAYESLLDRARREAILRMQDDAAVLGAYTIINVKFETSRISGNAGQGVGSIEVLAYGTALIPK
jgi:uncharacterized protein YbjQ (UPF0145 family)